MELPRTIYRISNTKYSKSARTALSGLGGLSTEGRWNEQGQKIVYCSSSSSLALLERLVYADEWMSLDDSDRDVLSITMPRVSIMGYTAEELERTDPNWFTAGNVTCRNLGSMWLTRKMSCVLSVPSSANRLEQNYLLNPEHPEIEKILQANAMLVTQKVVVDDRLREIVGKARAKA